MTNKQSKKRQLTRSQKDKLFYTLMMIYPVVQFCVFYIGVNINSVLLAFKQYDYGITQDSIAGYHWAGFSQFEKVFNMFKAEPVFLSALKNSLLSYVVIALSASTLTVFFAYYIFKKKALGNFFRIMLFLPSVISSLVMAILFTSMAESIIPKLINNAFSTDVKPLLTDPNTRFGMVIFYAIWVNFGTSVLLYNGSMAGIDNEIIEAAEIDGANGFKEFIFIIFPMVYPTFTTFFVTNLATLFTNQLSLHSIYGTSAPNDMYTFGYYMFVKIEDGTIADYTYLSAMGLLMTAVAVPVTLLVRKMLIKIGPSTD